MVLLFLKLCNVFSTWVLFLQTGSSKRGNCLTKSLAINSPNKKRAYQFTNCNFLVREREGDVVFNFLTLTFCCFFLVSKHTSVVIISLDHGQGKTFSNPRFSKFLTAFWSSVTTVRQLLHFFPVSEQLLTNKLFVKIICFSKELPFNIFLEHWSFVAFPKSF